ncbi:MAG: hypothetical protein ACHQ4H_07190 [Ktedonobacterales bacterium]
MPAPASGFATFTSSDGVYGLNAPSDWSKTALNTSPVVNGEIFISADGKSFFLTMPLSQSLPSDQFGSFVTGFAKGFNATGATASSGTTSTTIGNNTWTEQDGTMAIKGVASTVKLYGKALGANTVLLMSIAPAATNDQVTSTSFQPMLNSFTLLK